MINSELYERIIKNRPHCVISSIQCQPLNKKTSQVWEKRYLHAERRIFGNKQRKKEDKELLDSCLALQNEISDEQFTALLQFFDDNAPFRGKYFMEKQYKGAN